MSLSLGGSPLIPLLVPFHTLACWSPRQEGFYVVKTALECHKALSSLKSLTQNMNSIATGSLSRPDDAVILFF